VNEEIPPAGIGVPLGILDLSKRHGGSSHQALEHTIALAEAAEAAGFSRFCVAEHHVEDASHSTPAILVAAIAARTRRITVGSGAVLLRYYSPLNVAESFLTLQALFPGRIDLGVAQGPGVVDEAVAGALVGGNLWELDGDVFARKVLELQQFLHAGGQPEPGPRVRARPSDVVAPPLWVLGSGARSTDLAARLGTAHAVAAFGSGSTPGPVLCRRANDYRTRLPAPAGRFLITVSVTAAETDAQAQALDADRVTHGSMAANVVGSPATVTSKLIALQIETSADEILLVSFGGPTARWRDCLAAIADEWRSTALHL
jgi:luciferase family oxidoreductase group 1